MYLKRISKYLLIVLIIIVVINFTPLLDKQRETFKYEACKIDGIGINKCLINKCFITNNTLTNGCVKVNNINMCTGYSFKQI